MLFNSLEYAIFLPIVFLMYWWLPHRFRWMLMLMASYYFYMCWNVKYVVLILFTTGISYIAAIKMEQSDNTKDKKCILAITFIACLGVLFFFKYFNFFSESLVNLLSCFTIKLDPFMVDVLLPVGISFYTFQTLAYVVDVYRGEVSPEHNFGQYATFISFFPQLVAGPIERTRNLLPQIKAEHHFDYYQATYGLKLMAWGFFKKLVIADNLSSYVQMVYTNPTTFKGFALVLASVFFTIQIYCDFSGYSDIAVGTAKLFGIDLMTNFKSPYLSENIKEFWSRWHISLSTWFRDYVYIPLGGNRVSSWKKYRNILLTFAVSGLWHGANWTFVVWGLVHGFAQVLEFIFGVSKANNKLLWGIKVLVMFCFVTFAWIFFVSKSLNDAMYVINNMFVGISHPLVYLKKGFVDLNFGRSLLALNTFTILILVVYDYFSLKMDVISSISKLGVIRRWGLYTVFLLLIVLFSQKGVPTEFVYFQF